MSEDTATLVERVRHGIGPPLAEYKYAHAALDSLTAALERETDRADAEADRALDLARLSEEQLARAQNAEAVVEAARREITHALEIIRYANGERSSVNLTLDGIKDDLTRALAAIDEQEQM